MREKRYGGRKVMFSVVEKPDGRIEVRVLSTNAEERRRIQAKRTNPRYFLDHLDTYRDSPIRAKYWMGVIVSEFPSHFASNRVDFVLAGDAPKSEQRPTKAKQSHIEAKGEITDTELVVKASRNLEQLLREGLGAHGRGLGEQLESVEGKLPPALREELRGITRIRNRLVDERRASLRGLGMSQEQFRQLYDRAERGLRALADRLHNRVDARASRR